MGILGGKEGKKSKEGEEFTSPPFKPAVPEGVLGPAAQDRIGRRFQRGLNELGGEFVHEVWRHQYETGETGKTPKGTETRKEGQVPQLPPSGSSESKG